MKDPVLAVITILKANDGVSGQVGTRVYRAMLPLKPVFPCIVVNRVDVIQDEITSSAKYATARVQCTTFTASDGAAENISDLILAALEDQQNTHVSGVYIVDVDDAGAVPDNTDGLTLGVYRDFHDFKVIYQNR